ncbi:MAG TPA: polymer-forming cytoskeletal protein, partial [Polyangiaceae bacterium]
MLLKPLAWAWLMVGASLLACSSKPAETRDSPASIRQAVVTPGQLESAGLVVLGSQADAIDLGPRARLVVDRALTNGGLSLQPEARATGDLEAVGSARLKPQATVQGDLTLGGTLTLQSGASVSGSVQEHASVPTRAFPAAEAVAMQAGSFGALGADIVVAHSASVALTDRTQQLRRLVVESRGTLLVSGQVRLEVLEHFSVGPQAKLVVQAGGSLTLLLRGSGQLGPQARVEQQGQDRALGLRLFVTASGTLDLQAASHFGPGLIYYPGRDLGTAELRPSEVDGAIVCGKLTTAPAAVLGLNARYLRCALDVLSPRIVISEPGSATSVPETQTTIDLAGRVEDDGAIETLEVTDAAGTRALSPDGAGAFSTSATLRPDGEPTRICVRAIDCAGRTALECRVVEVESPLDLAITYPPYGQRLTSASVNLQGR